jgi:hypothetical protein
MFYSCLVPKDHCSGRESRVRQQASTNARSFASRTRSTVELHVCFPDPGLSQGAVKITIGGVSRVSRALETTNFINFLK